MRRVRQKFVSAERRRALRLRILLGAFFLITALWSLLFLPNLRSAPPWYGDEILSLTVGKDLFHGQLASRATYCTFFSPTYNYQPAYAWLVGLFSWVTGGDILGGRFFSACIGFATAVLGFWFWHRKFGISVGLAFIFLLFGYSQAVVHYRWIYPHNVVGLSLLASTCILMRPWCLRNDWKAGGYLALGAGSHLLAANATMVSVLCRLKHPKSWIAIALPPFLVFALTFGILSWIFPGWVQQDLTDLLRQHARYDQENGKGLRVFVNFWNFMTQDGFHWASVIGCLLCLRRRSYFIAFATLAMVFLLTRNRQNIPLFYYQAMMVFPLLVSAISVGFSSALNRVFHLAAWSRSRRRVLRWLLPLVALVFMVGRVPESIEGLFQVRITPWVVRSSADYETASRWLNQNTLSGDLVITYWNLGWLLKARTADVLCAAAWSGYPAGDYFPYPPDHQRFRYPADIHRAKFFAVTELDEQWAFAQGQVIQFLKDSRLDLWPLVYQCGAVKVLANPNWRQE